MWLYLDDKEERVPFASHNTGKGLGLKYSNNSDWTIVRNFDDFKSAIDTYGKHITVVSFDHDIHSYSDGVEMTGKNAAEYLTNYCQDNNLKLPGFYVHSSNTPGIKNIVGWMSGYLKSIEGIEIKNTAIRGYIDGDYFY